MENVHELFSILKIQVFLFIGVRQILRHVHASKILGLLLFFLNTFMNSVSLLFADVGVETVQEQFVLSKILESLPFRHILARQVSLNLELFFNDCHFLILFASLQFSLFDCIPSLLLVLIKIAVKSIHVFFQHFLSTFQSLAMQSSHFLEFIDLLTFVVNKHLEQQCLSLFTNELVHGLIDLYSVLNSIFGCLNKAHFGLVLLFILLMAAEIIKLFDGDSMFFDTFLPDLHFLFLSFFLPFALAFLLLHPENLRVRASTSASSGIENGLACLPAEAPDQLLSNLGRKLRFSLSSANQLILISYIFQFDSISLFIMYALLDCLCFLSGIGGFVACLVKSKPVFLPIPLAWLALYPILNQAIYNFFAGFQQKKNYDPTPSSRIIYHPSYNISFCGLEKMHPFDSQKYGNVYRRLVDKKIIKGDDDVIQPSKIPRGLLLQKMSKLYLLKLCYSIPLCSYIQMPLCFLPNFLLRWRVLDPMLLATEGSILAAISALKLKWSINLSGGYHHATCKTGGGFCIYPDITMAAHYLQTRMGIGKVMIIDLDAHQGNGHEMDHLNRDDIYIVDAYNHRIYPGDHEAKNAISRDISVSFSTHDHEYIREIYSIAKDIKAFKPDFVIYNAGTDCLEGDPLGNLSLSAEAIIKRDEAVFQICLDNKVPIMMILSGGYQQVNAEVIANSIANLYQKFG